MGNGVAPDTLRIGDRWKCMISFTSRPLNLRGKSGRHTLNKRLGGPQVWSEPLKEQKYFLPLSVIEAKSIGFTAAASHYIDRAFWAPKEAYLITYLLIYLLTYSMEHSPFWEANRFSASQEIPRILWNPKVHYRVYKWSPPVPILREYQSRSEAFCANIS
jgi:hypothetical protein